MSDAGADSEIEDLSGLRLSPAVNPGHYTKPRPDRGGCRQLAGKGPPIQPANFKLVTCPAQAAVALSSALLRPLTPAGGMFNGGR